MALSGVELIDKERIGGNDDGQVSVYGRLCLRMMMVRLERARLETKLTIPNLVGDMASNFGPPKPHFTSRRGPCRSAGATLR